MWKISATDAVERADVQAGFRRRLEGLRGAIPGLVTLEVHTDVGTTEGNWDVMLISEHESVEALAVYQSHPDHTAAGAWIRERVSARACVDTEL